MLNLYLALLFKIIIFRLVFKYLREIENYMLIDCKSKDIIYARYLCDLENLHKKMRTREKSVVSQVITDTRTAELMIYEDGRGLKTSYRELIGKLMVSRETNARGYLPRNATACER